MITRSQLVQVFKTTCVVMERAGVSTENWELNFAYRRIEQVILPNHGRHVVVCLGNSNGEMYRSMQAMIETAQLIMDKDK